MKKAMMILACCTLFFSSCKQRNYVYSTASLNRAYEYDPYWDYKGYSPHENIDNYRRYDPDRNDDIVKNLKDKDEDLRSN